MIYIFIKLINSNYISDSLSSVIEKTNQKLAGNSFVNYGLVISYFGLT